MAGPTTDVRLVELTSGVDGLYLSGGSALGRGLLDDLAEAKQAAQQAGGEVPFEPLSDEFRVAPSGMGRYRFCLRHPHGQIGLTDSSALPPLWVQVRAGFLHAVGPRVAVEWFSDLAASLGSVPLWTTSRLDLFCDTQGWQLTADDRDRFLNRAKARVTHETDGVFTGFQFGRRATGTVSARIYDKTMEAAQKGHDWWLDKWGSAYRPGERVLRVEFELRRTGLGQFHLGSVDETLGSAAGLWAYCTDRWLTYRIRSGDATLSRWPLAPEWEFIQGSALRGDAIGLDRVYAGNAAGSIRRILPGLRGYLASAGAFTGSETLEDSALAAVRLLRADEEESGVPFAGRVEDKRRRLRSA
jgi:hypothetical protein